jgi:ABC-type dipeptide/oligopeptide/nickel transport system permease subunit
MTKIDKSFRNLVINRLLTSFAILLIIIFISIFTLTEAQKGRIGLPIHVLNDLGEALKQTFLYLFDHPTTYLWHKVNIPAYDLIKNLFSTSVGLLLVSLLFATVGGVALGMGAAFSHRNIFRPLMVIVSILGTSTPTFLLGMFFWIINVYILRWFEMSQAPLPPTGFGWDLHLIMPALVLATRPLAQITQITYVNLTDVLAQDYIRSAKAKGLSSRLVAFNHAMPNIYLPVLTTLGTSLRFSLASLPVVESFFLWPGLGLGILQAIQLEMVTLITDLIVALGAMFLITNLALEMIYPLLDARLQKSTNTEERFEDLTFGEHWFNFQDLLLGLWHSIINLPSTIRNIVKQDISKVKNLKHYPSKKRKQTDQNSQNNITEEYEKRAASTRQHYKQSALKNPTLIVGSLLFLGFIFLVIAGPQLASADPFETHNIVMIEKIVYAPPFPPSSMFPWGGDVMGRDVQALVLHGIRQTISLALLGMLARMALGVILGMVSGWWSGSRLDQLVNSAISILAAFPVTILAMVIILALGINQGARVFIIAICLTSWGEITQLVRGQVISIKPQLFIEAARSIGARPLQIMTRHLIPVLMPSLLVLGVLEMGGVLMLLADLGFLNIFVGGGFASEIIGGTIFYYSDVPEWGAMLANIRNWWRSYPWLAWYPGMGFFLLVLTFNLFGEGLRRFMEDTQMNLSRIFNRYTVFASIVIITGFILAFRSNSPMGLYRSQALQFDAQSTLKDIEELTSPKYKGRETGTPGNRLAADYIASRMEEVGLFPAGEKDTYLWEMVNPRFHLNSMPIMEILDDEGTFVETLEYRLDYSEYVGESPNYGEGQGPIMGAAFGPPISESPNDRFLLNQDEHLGKVLILRESTLEYVNLRSGEGNAAGILIVSDNPDIIQRKNIHRHGTGNAIPSLYISQETAERLLSTGDSSIAELDHLTANLSAGEYATTDDGVTIHLSIADAPNEDITEKYVNVIGFIPGTGAAMGSRPGEGLDNQVIIVSAYFDGLGVGPDGTLYPGANDNASGVAAMLEMARVLKEGVYQPKKTIVFIAWSGGERMESMDTFNLMNAKIGFGLLNVEAIIELSGVGGGTGNAIAITPGSSYRLLSVYQEAGKRLNVPITTRGRGPHYGESPGGAFGGRTEFTAYVSWDGSDVPAHTPFDTIEAIDLKKIDKIGKTSMLVLTIIGREVDY